MAAWCSVYALIPSWAIKQRAAGSWEDAADVIVMSVPLCRGVHEVTTFG